MGGQIFGNHNVKYPNLQYHFAPAFNKELCKDDGQNLYPLMRLLLPEVNILIFLRNLLISVYRSPLHFAFVVG